MALEIARLTVDPEHAQAFEDGVRQAVPLFEAAAGCRGVRLLRSHEAAGGYWLLVDWDDVAAHELFRGTPAFAQWRSLVGHYFIQPPVVEHGLASTLVHAMPTPAASTGDNS